MLVLQLSRCDGGWLEHVETAGVFLRVAQPVLIISASLVHILWKLVHHYGIRMSTGLSIECAAEEGENVLLGATKSKRKTRQQTEEDLKPIFRPRRLLLLALLLAASCSYLNDAVAALTASILFRGGAIDGTRALWLLLCAVAYWLPAVSLIFTARDPLGTKAEYYAAIAILCRC